MASPTRGCEFEQAPEDSAGQGYLVCCGLRGRRELYMIQRFNSDNSLILGCAGSWWPCGLFSRCGKWGFSPGCGLALGVHVASPSRDLQFPCLTSSGAYWEFKRALKEFIFLHGKKWAASLPLLHLAFRASSSQASPFHILTGAEERLTEPLWWEMSSANIEGLMIYTLSHVC